MKTLFTLLLLSCVPILSAQTLKENTFLGQSGPIAHTPNPSSEGTIVCQSECFDQPLQVQIVITPRSGCAVPGDGKIEASILQHKNGMKHLSVLQKVSVPFTTSVDGKGTGKFFLMDADHSFIYMDTKYTPCTSGTGVYDLTVTFAEGK